MTGSVEEHPSGPAAPAESAAVEEAFNEAYAFLRKAIGVIALLLPVGVVIGNGWLGHSWELKGSISAYYYTPSRNYFVGSLCALAVFFLSYEYRDFGKYRADNYLSDFACVTALGVAFLPTTRGGVQSTRAEEVVGIFHYISAGALFLTLAVFCLFFFTRSQGVKTPQKIVRNRVYRSCGVIILSCLGLCLIAMWKAPESWRALFWLESVMVWAFAISWLVKGEFGGILADKPAVESSR